MKEGPLSSEEEETSFQIYFYLRLGGRGLGSKDTKLHIKDEFQGVRGYATG